MPNKKEVLRQLDDSGKPTYTIKEVKAIVNSIRKEIAKPTELKKGDVYVTSIGGKKRPVVVCGIIGNTVIGIPISTTEDGLNAVPFVSRFCGDNYFTKQVITSTYEHAMENFSGIFDNDTAVDKALEYMKKFYKDIL
jgi:hypothetical protein